jgi:solute carrier family 6 GABA transporter-like protein 1
MGATTIYRVKDVIDQVGLLPVLIFNIGLVLAEVLGLAVGHAVMPEAGAGVGFGLFLLALIVSVLMAKTPHAETPRAFSSSPLMRKFFWIVFYSVSLP